MAIATSGSYAATPPTGRRVHWVDARTGNEGVGTVEVSWCGLAIENGGRWVPVDPGPDGPGDTASVTCAKCVEAISSGQRWARRWVARPRTARAVRTEVRPRSMPVTLTNQVRADVAWVLDTRRRDLEDQQARARTSTRTVVLGARIDELNELHDQFAARGWADPRSDGTRSPPLDVRQG